MITSSNPGQKTTFLTFFFQNDKFFTVHYLDWCSEWPLDVILCFFTYAFKMAVAIAFLRENAVEAIYLFFRPSSTVLKDKDKNHL